MPYVPVPDRREEYMMIGKTLGGKADLFVFSPPDRREEYTMIGKTLGRKDGFCIWR